MNQRLVRLWEATRRAIKDASDQPQHPETQRLLTSYISTLRSEYAKIRLAYLQSVSPTLNEIDQALPDLANAKSTTCTGLEQGFVWGAGNWPLRLRDEVRRALVARVSQDGLRTFLTVSPSFKRAPLRFDPQ
ncbi:MAG: hypothetical protein AAGA48_11380 [Myxococcota bacterium]